MANLLSRLFGRAEIARGLTLDQYLRQMSAQYGQYMPPIVSYGPTGQPTERPPVDFENLVTQTFAANPIIYGLVTKRGLIFSEARFMWQEMADGRGGDLRYDDGLALLEKPWPNGSTGEMLMRIDQDVSLAGNAYIVRERDRLRRLRPDWVQIVLSGNPIEEHDIDVVGYVYGAGSADSGNFKAYLPDEVAHISPVPDPLAAYRGVSWLTPVIREVQADKAATEHKLSFLRNGAVLGPIIKAPPGISLDQFKKFIEAAESAHVGPQNAGRFLFLASGSDVTTVGANMQQIDFKALMGSAETRMTVAALMPAVIAGVSEGLQGSSLNAGNYQAAKRAFADGTLRPLWRIVCAELETILDVPEGSRLWFDETGVAFLREDQQDVAGIQAQQATTMNTLVTAGFDPKSIVTAVRENDWSKLKHTGLTSVQLSEPGSGGPNGDQTGADNGGGFAPDTQGQQDALDTSRSQIVRAQSDTHTGAMIALVPSEGDAHRLAVDGGEPVDELHLTFYYLGDAKDIPAADRKSIVDAVKAAVDRNHVTAVEANVFGAALWNPNGDEPSWVLNVGDPQQRPAGQQSLAVIRRAVGDALAYGAPDFRMVRQHTPWASHVCVAYGADTTDSDELADKVGAVTFDRLRIAFGGRVTDIPLDDAKRSRIERARRKRDGDGDGFYDPDGKGPLPDKTPAPKAGAFHVGFTGTRAGMTPGQREYVRRRLAELKAEHGDVTLHHGQAVGADAEAVAIAHSLGVRTVSHPSNLRAQTAAVDSHETRAPKPPLDRNRDIVGESSLMLATPQTEREQLRSGTWATIRHSRKTRTPIEVIPPSGAPTPAYLDPEAFSGDIAIRLHSGESAQSIADDLAYQARNLRDSARTEGDKEKRAALLRVARQREATAKQLQAVADLPRKPKPTVPNPRPVPARPAPPKPNPRTVPPAPLPSGEVSPELQKLMDDFAAGRVSKAQVMVALRREPDKVRILSDYVKGRISRDDANRLLGDITDEQAASVSYGLAFLHSYVLADEAAQLAQRGDREGLEDYLRRQNTSMLKFASQGHYGLSWPKPRPGVPQPTHAQVVAKVADAVWAAEGPSSLATAADRAAKATGRATPEAPSRSQLLRRLKADLQRDAERAGIDTRGMTKERLADALLAAFAASGIR